MRDGRCKKKNENDTNKSRRSTPTTSMSIGTNGIVLFGGYMPDVQPDDEGWPPRRPVPSTPLEMGHATMWTGPETRVGDTLRGPRLDASESWLELASASRARGAMPGEGDLGWRARIRTTLVPTWRSAARGPRLLGRNQNLTSNRS